MRVLLRELASSAHACALDAAVISAKMRLDSLDSEVMSSASPTEFVALRDELKTLMLDLPREQRHTPAQIFHLYASVIAGAVIAIAGAAGAAIIGGIVWTTGTGGAIAGAGTGIAGTLMMPGAAAIGVAAPTFTTPGAIVAAGIAGCPRHTRTSNRKIASEWVPSAPSCAGRASQSAG